MKRVLVLLVVAITLTGVAVGLAYMQIVVKPQMIKGFIAKAGPSVNTVAATQARAETWRTTLQAIGSLRAIQGVDVAPQIGGVIRAIQFESGADVEQGATLVEIDDSIEQADLKANLALHRNAEIVFQRQSALIDRGNTTQALLDAALAARDQAAANVERIRAVIAQKVIVAPFSGRLGVRRIDLGQYVSPGAALVSLQHLDPIYVDFQTPEQNLSQLVVGAPLEATFDAYPGEVFKGAVKVLEARVNADTRNFLVRGELENPKKSLLPGMFANITVTAGAPQNVVTLPRTAVTFSLYGDAVFIVKPREGDDSLALTQAAANAQADGPLYTIERRFVRTGDVRGDRIAILEGVNVGDIVVSEGQIKLAPGMLVRVDPKAGLPPLVPLPNL